MTDDNLVTDLPVIEGEALRQENEALEIRAAAIDALVAAYCADMALMDRLQTAYVAQPILFQDAGDQRFSHRQASLMPEHVDQIVRAALRTRIDPRAKAIRSLLRDHFGVSVASLAQALRDHEADEEKRWAQAEEHAEYSGPPPRSAVGVIGETISTAFGAFGERGDLPKPTDEGASR